MILGFLIINLFLLLEICISTYMISYCKKQEFDYSIFEIGLKSYLFVVVAGLILSIINNFVFDFGFFRNLSSYGSKDVPPFAIYIVITGFVIGIFTLLYTSIISAMPNSINITEENKDTFSSVHRKIFFLFQALQLLNKMIYYTGVRLKSR